MNDANRVFSRHQIVDLGVLLSLAGLIAVYCFHVWSISTHVLNTILVVPLSVLALGLCGVEFVRQLKDREHESKELEPVRSVLPVMLMFSLYVLSLPWLGFDVGTALFVMIFLLLHGERRWHWAVSYGLVFGFLAALTFSSLLPYPMPMLLLPSEY